jgi:hypothetical protein
MREGPGSYERNPLVGLGGCGCVDPVCGLAGGEGLVAAEKTLNKETVVAEATRRRLRRVHPSLVTVKDKTDYFLQAFSETMKEMFPKPAEPPPGWGMPRLANFSMRVSVSSESESERQILELRQVGAVVADKAGEFARFLALELRPGEHLIVTVERHEDIPLSGATPVVMPR